MSTSRKMPFLSEIAAGDPVPHEVLAYFQERARGHLYNYVMTKFLEREQAEGLTRAQLARRIRRSPEVITRLMGAPGNWTINTISDLLIGIAAEELVPDSASVLNRRRRNFTVADIFEMSQEPERSRETATDTKSRAIDLTAA